MWLLAHLLLRLLVAQLLNVQLEKKFNQVNQMMLCSAIQDFSVITPLLENYVPFAVVVANDGVVATGAGFFVVGPPSSSSICQIIFKRQFKDLRY